MPPTAPEELIDAGTPATPTAAAELIEAGTPATPTGAHSLVVGAVASDYDMIVGGVTTPDMSGPLLEWAEAQEGKAAYSTGAFESPGDNPYVLIIWTESAGGKWTIKKATGGVLNGTDIFTSAEDVATPDLVTTWTAGGAATGTPVVSASTVTAAEDLIDSGTPASPTAPGELI